MRGPWRDRLIKHVGEKPICILRLANEDYNSLDSAINGLGQFTIALHHQEFSETRTPTFCLLIAKTESQDRLLAGIIGNPSAVTTLQSRVKLKRVFPIDPKNPSDLVTILDVRRFETALKSKIDEEYQISNLSPKLSQCIIEALSEIDSNEIALRSISSSLNAPRYVRGNSALQEQSLRTALRAFGLAADAPADSVQLLNIDDTALARVSTADETSFDEDQISRRAVRSGLHAIEDGFIEHEARTVRGLDLVRSDATGRAVYSRGDEKLEVITANRRPLELAFGVDLIYINLVHKNIVMVQHKILRKIENRWIYRPDDQLRKEIDRMNNYLSSTSDNDSSYRLHDGIFYLKFVKQDASIRQGGILLPLDHYNMYISDKSSRGPRDGIRIDYEGLSGRYMREQPFVDLIRSGYIGSFDGDTKNLRIIIDAILSEGNALVAAIQSK